MQRTKLIALIKYTLIALCGVTLVAMPVVATYGPVWARQYRTSKAASSDLKTREMGLNYIIKNAPRDAGIRKAAVDLMAKTDDDANFLQIMRALDYAGVWNRQNVPALTYLRWLGILARDPNPKNRMTASQFLGELADIADNPAVSTLVSLMITDTDAEARYAALVACADLAHAGNNPEPYVALIKQLVADPNKIVAQQAWLMLGSLKAADTLPADLGKLPDPVAQAAAWALITSGAKGADEVVLKVALDPAVPMPTRTGVVYGLKDSNQKAIQLGLTQLIYRLAPPAGALPPAANLEWTTKEQELEAIAKKNDASGETLQLSPANAWLIWRAILALHETPGDETSSAYAIAAFSRPMFNNKYPSQKDDPNWNMLSCAATLQFYRHAGPMLKLIPTQAAIPLDVRSSAMRLLAALEGLPPVTLKGLKPEPEDSIAIKLATLRASETINVDDIYPLLTHEATFVRDQACIIAWQRMNKEDQSSLVARLLKDYNDNAKMSGGFLAGLTGTQKELLDRRVRDEDVWAVKQVLRMGQFMQTPGPFEKPRSQNHENLRALLMRQDLPRSTLTLGLLFKHDDGPLEFLLNPKGEPYLPLVEVFDDKRWWHALKPLLPKEMPGFEVWGDPGLMAFQIDLMRNWYLVNKRKLTWPEHAKN